MGYRLVILFLLLASSAVYAQPSFNKFFTPNTIGPGSISVLSFDIDNGSSSPVTDLSFIDNLPAGMTIASPPGILTDCVNALVIAPVGSSAISLTEARLSAGSRCVLNVNVTASSPGIFMNVSGDLTSSAGNSGSAADDLTVDAGLPGFSKSFSPSTVNFGERSTLTFTIDNTLNAANTFNLSFTDEFPIGMEVAGPANASTTCNGGVFTATPGSNTFSYGPEFGGDAGLIANTTCTVSVDVIANAAGLLPNVSGDLSSISTFFSEVSGRAGAELQVNVDDELILTQSFTDDPVLAGDTVTLEFRLQNPDRNFAATNIAFTDDLTAVLAGLTAVGLPLTDICGAGSEISGGAILTFTGGSLAADSECVFNVSLQVPAAAPVGAFPNVTSNATADVAGFPVVGEPASDTLFVNEAPVFTKTFSSNVAGAGEMVSMEFTITNSSVVSAATDVAFEDDMGGFLSGVTVVGGTGAGVCGAGSFLFTFFDVGQLMLSLTGGVLAAGESCTFAVDLLVPVGAPGGIFTNTTTPITAIVNGVTQVGRVASDDLLVTSAPTLDKTFTDDPVNPGDTVTLEFTIEHDMDSPADATDISFTDDLNVVIAGLVATGLPINDVCGVGSQLTGTDNLTFTGGLLSPGQTCTFSVVLQVPAAALPGVFTNTTSAISASVSGTTVTGTPASDDLNVNGLEFSKEFIDDPVIAGGIVTLRYTIENTSATTDATGVFFTDILSAALPGLMATAPLPVSPCGAGSSVSGTTFLIFVGGNLTAGTSCSFDVSVLVPAGAIDNTYLSTTSSLTASIGGLIAVIPPAFDALMVNSAVLMLDKTFTDDPVGPGDMVNLEFTVTNQDMAQAVTNISFMDDLDAALTGLVAIGTPANDVCGVGSVLSGTGILTLAGASLAAGASCTFSVGLQVPAVSPTGSFINTTSGLSGTLAGLPVTGEPASDVLLVQNVEFTKVFATPVVVTGNSTTLSFTILNDSSSLINNISFSDDLDAVVSGMVATTLPLNDVCGEGSVFSGTSFLTLTSASLLPGASCSFDVTVIVPLSATPGVFTNTTSDLFVSGLTIASPAVADIQVMGIPALTITPAATDFGNQLLGVTSAAMVVTLENSGTDNLDITTITAVAAPFAVESMTCGALPFTLAAMTSCTVNYTFTPTALGVANQTLMVTTNAASSPDNFSLQGNGVQPNIAISPGVVDFGDQLITTTSAAMSVTIQNTGTADLNVADVTAAIAPFALNGGSCTATPFMLVPNASCTLDYTFMPSMAGLASQDIMLMSDAPSGVDTLTLQGNGTQAGLGLSAAVIDLGDANIGETVDMPLTLTSTGDGALTVTAISDPLAPFVIDMGSCGALPLTLQPTDQCQLDISFTPSALGAVNAMFDVTSNAPTSPDAVQLQGNGTQAGLSLDVTMLDFGDVTVDTTADLVVMLTSTGDGSLTVTALSDPLAPFAVGPGTCGALPFTLLPTEQCQLDVSFTPSVTGNANAMFTIDSNAPTSPDSVSVQGNGVQPLLVLSLSDIDFEITTAGATRTLPLELMNTGDGILTIADITDPLAPFTVGFSSCGPLPIVLMPTEQCTLDVTFSPLFNREFVSAFDIVSNADDSPATVNVRGIGFIVEVPTLNTWSLLMLATLLFLLSAYNLQRRAHKSN